jgi:glutaredoxin
MGVAEWVAMADHPGMNGEQKRIVLYGGAGLPACSLVERFLRRRGQPFEVRDVYRDPHAQNDLAAMGCPSVPVTRIDGGRPIVGADFKALEAALA